MKTISNGLDKKVIITRSKSSNGGYDYYLMYMTKHYLTGEFIWNESYKQIAPIYSFHKAIDTAKLILIQY